VKKLVALGALVACGHAAPPGAGTPGTSHATPPSCEMLVAHLAEVFGQRDLAPADRHDLIASCEKDAPPVSERTCVMKAKTPAEVDACGKAGAPPTPGVTDVSPAPADPKADLLALGIAVARYRAQLGEPPPGAGPTPAAGACCPDACPADETLWTGPWQLVRFGLDHGTRWSFEIDRPTDDDGTGPVIVKALACPGQPGYQITIAPGTTPAPADIVATPAGP
jgi:hypothetical protein